MSFNSLIFIFLFLPISLFLYNILNDKLKFKLLIFLSIIFYSYSSLNTLILILFSISINYIFSYYITKTQFKKQLLILGVFLNLTFLFYYKYSMFFANTILGKDFYFDLIVPLGLSYISFQQISYIVDIYKNKFTLPKISIYTLYILFFPKLIAGPISNFDDFQSNEYKSSTLDLLESGAYRFSIGLGKKVIIASTLQNFVDIIYLQNPNSIPSSYIWLAMITYSLQIYFDFSGYTDMALGIAQMFSISLPENFNKPYLSDNITEFWKRWHISLTTFLRNYIYIPLGGSKCSKIRCLINTLTVFLLSGLWHGASFTFIIWGLYHGLFIIIEKLFLNKLLIKVPKTIKIFTCFITVSIGWIFFRADNLSYSLNFIKRLIGIGGENFIDLTLLQIDLKFIVFLIIALILVFSPKISTNNNLIFYSSRFFSLLVFIYSLAIIASGSFKPFIYFNF